MNLVIVESPAKSKTIEKYLGKDYKVVSSVGHIRDLSTKGKYGLGVDVDNDFKPDYEPMPSKKKVINDLKKLVKEADTVYLATDPDREGEAISWHLFDTLKIKEDNYLRVLFYEITKEKVLEGLKNPRKIDYNLVKSQETRRILDRIIGFRLSKLMQNKTGGKSAGRVQSVALKLVVDREREILAFKSTPYYKITAKFHDKNMESELFAQNGKDLEIVEKSVADDILSKLSDTFLVSNIEKKKKNRASKFPFTTSTLQQEASTKLGFPAKKTMSIAQKLYEGLDIGSEHTGLITYMRTDSIRLSDEFVLPTFHFIEENFGKEYVGYVKKSKKQENVQDAHEGIRPTSILRTPKSLEKHLTADELKLYTLIYYRTVASLMADAKTDVTTITLDNNGYNFKSSGTVITFDGYLKVYSKYEEANDTILPELNKDEILNTKDIEISEHFTKPKSRYTEAKLIHELEELGIGRPSTYATIMSNIREIAEGLLDNIKVLHAFYDVFDKTLHEAFVKMERTKPTETGEMCPVCSSPLVIRKGKYGEFTACSNYPDCTYVKKEEKEAKPIVEIMDCPKCGGKIVEKITKKGKTFYGCNNFPKCKVAVWDKPTGELCPKCNGLIVETKDGNKCNDCNYQV